MESLYITQSTPLPSPSEVLSQIPLSEEQASFIAASRSAINNILFGDDPRLLLILGPCSIHHPSSAIEYAKKLKSIISQTEDYFFPVMRTYFQKPRTSLGWKGLIYDPHLDNSSDVHTGILTARRILSEIIDLQIPTATEFLDPIIPSYLSDLISWAAIGARTTESQIHRQLASGLTIPTGFKNNTDGSVTAALHAIKASQQPQTFFGIDSNGSATAHHTEGNPHTHLILRGGKFGPNYNEGSIQGAIQLSNNYEIPPAIIVDCAHDNSDKNPIKQLDIFSSAIQLSKKYPIKGIMLESHLQPGNQPFPSHNNNLCLNTSITDPCLGWKDTENLLLSAIQKPNVATSS